MGQRIHFFPNARVGTKGTIESMRCLSGRILCTVLLLGLTLGLSSPSHGREKMVGVAVGGSVIHFDPIGQWEERMDEGSVFPLSVWLETAFNERWAAEITWMYIRGRRGRWSRGWGLVQRDTPFFYWEERLSLGSCGCWLKWRLRDIHSAKIVPFVQWGLGAYLGNARIKGYDARQTEFGHFAGIGGGIEKMAFRTPLFWRLNVEAIAGAMGHWASVCDGYNGIDMRIKVLTLKVGMGYRFSPRSCASARK